MRWAGRLMTSVAAVLLTAGGASALTADGGASSADVAWAAATKANSLEAYAKFAMAYPESEHVLAAYERLSRSVKSVKASSEAAAPESAAGYGDYETDGSSPGILPGTIMII
jgi:hypothetical protein